LRPWGSEDYEEDGRRCVFDAFTTKDTIMNHAEEAAFWYLRLNGFFAITNFVVHASGGVTHSSDCDVLGVRLPFVYEEVGGQDGDWDTWLTERLDFARLVGIVCEVKSGAYETERLFREEVLRYSIARLGFVPIEDVASISDAFQHKPVIAFKDGTEIAKLLVARDEAQGPFLMRRLGDVEDFLIQRIKR
jgi:hypothetical protein